MYQELDEMYGLVQKMIKQDILDANNSVTKLMKHDLNSNRCHEREMKIGIATSSLLGKLKISEGHKLNVQDKCQDIFIGTLTKVRITRAISALNA